MKNVRDKLLQINENIDMLVATHSSANRYIYGKKLKEQIELLLKDVIKEESDLVSQELKRYDR